MDSHSGYIADPRVMQLTRALLLIDSVKFVFADEDRDTLSTLYCLPLLY